MKTLLLLPMLGALALPAAAQTSQEQADPQQQVVPVKGNEARIDLPDHDHKMGPTVYAPYQKTYSLSNGMALSSFTRGDTVYARVDHIWHRVGATSPDT